ncbi:hypothetical protein M6G53_24410 [Serratia nevei]|uniref:hypothetical protein n=1 Tax=Serratia nevei TaxID=2703794 RepID=UPI00209CF12C|nr:hypothetical protein [Serratia nevei]MCP1108511.1 hypothetical protein [Serratia nevei]
MQPNKRVEFDHELCLAIGRAVLDVVAQGQETSAPAVMSAIERSLEQGLNDDETAAADDALDLMARLVQHGGVVNPPCKGETAPSLVEFQALQE